MSKKRREKRLGKKKEQESLTPSPSPNGEGSSMGGYPYWAACTCHRVFSLTERTEFTEVFGAHFEPTEGLRHTEFTEASPPTPLRLERGVVCEVTPIGLLAHIIEFFLSQNSQI